MSAKHSGRKRHKWVDSPNGDKICSICGSRISNRIGFPKYYQGSESLMAMNDYIDYYPICSKKE
jgi:hypothetical protein